MKRIVLAACCLLSFFASNAQEFPSDLGTNPKYDEHPQPQQDPETAPANRVYQDPCLRIAIGLQYYRPVGALSVKWGISPVSSLEALVAPSPMAGDNNYFYSFYGARYIYHFRFNHPGWYGPYTASYPYLFCGAGLLTYYNSEAETATKNNGGAMMGGVGYEFIFLRYLALNFELGFDNLKVDPTTNNTQTEASGAVGLHFYFPVRSFHNVKVTEESIDEEVNPADGTEATQGEDEQPATKPGRHHRSRKSDDD